jgi:2'-5' RNA ligase
LVVDVGEWHAAIAKAVPDRVRVLHPEDVHVTLAFLSGVAPECAKAAWEAARTVPLPSMTVRLAKMIPLGPEEGWTALSATLGEGSTDVANAMLAARDLATDAAGARRESRAPLPHVTLARLHAKATDAQREAARAWASALTLSHIELRLSEIALYTGRRERPPGQPAYQIIERTPLG